MHISSIEESISDILLTPLGSRICLPEYGSELHKLIDRRVDASFKADLTRYVFEAVLKWEKRVKPIRIKSLTQYGDRIFFDLELDNGYTLAIKG